MSLHADPYRLLATASHDLRQALQTLRLINAALLRRTHGPEVDELLQQEAVTLDAMSDLLNALLNISRLEAGGFEPQTRPISMRSMLRELEQQFRPVAFARGLDLDVESENVHVHSDPTLLREMLQNLIANAIRYTDQGGVTVCARARHGKVLIEVADTGVGMTSNVAARMFEDFYQGEARGPSHRGGVGLGLGIVRRISHALHIPVHARSAPGAGACFTLELPAQAAPEAVEEERRRDAPATRRQHTIVLVEDEESVRAAICMYLRLEGHLVMTAGSLAELDSLFASMSRRVDLLITDFHLGADEHGAQAIEKARRCYGPGTPAIVLTGDTTLAPGRLAHPNVLLVTKPVDARELSRVVDRLLAINEPASETATDQELSTTNVA